jgi:RNA polymerase sigma-70 factor, ECF subfamily
MECSQVDEATRDDLDLLRHVAHGDQDALDVLYARHRLRLWRYLWQHLSGDASWVEEVMQDVWLAVWRSAHTFRAEAKVTTWLFHIAHHCIQKAWRDRHFHPEREHSMQASETLGALPAVASPEEAVMARISLATAFARLSLKHSEVLELLFFHGFTVEEAATILEVPIGTVKSRLSYAKRALHDALAVTQALEGSRHEA